MTSLLANHLWQSTLFAGAAGLLVLALRNNRAQVRYWVWLIASLKFLIPFSLIVALGSLLAPATTTVPAASAGFSNVVAEIGQPFVAPSVSIAAVHPGTNPVPGILFAVWLCGFLVVAFRWYARWRRVRATVRAARPVALGTADRSAESMIAAQPGAAQNSGAEASAGPSVEMSLDAARRSACATFDGFSTDSTNFAAGSGVRVLSSPALLEPGIFGIFRPVLVLPEGIAEHLTREHLNAILAHELCHVRRRDNLFAALHMLIEAIFWFHPLVWWIGARLVEERERACDEEVLRLGNPPEIYAESILKTCRFYLESPLACMSGVTGADLKKRVVRIMTQHVGQRIGFARKALLTAAGTFVIAGPLAFGVMNAPQGLAQSTTAEPSGTKPRFEVASIKPDKSGYPGMWIGGDHGGFQAHGITIEMLIQNAYDLHRFQISGGPHWINSARYEIDAKPGAFLKNRRLTKGQRKALRERKKLMLQSLLADRCRFRFHTVTKRLPIYALVIGKSGPKLQRTKRGELSGMAMGRGELTGHDLPVPLFAANLSNILGRIVVDRTRLRGDYDFTLKWAPNQMQSRPWGPNSEGVLPASASNGPSIFTAVQEQLGLKLKPEKGPVTVYVIDHVERPSAN